MLIVQNDTGNKHSPTVIAAAITSQTGKARLPTHIELNAQSVGLSRDSVILLEQVRTIDKSRLRERMGKLDDTTMTKVDNAIAVSSACNISCSPGRNPGSTHRGGRGHAQPACLHRRRKCGSISKRADGLMTVLSARCSARPGRIVRLYVFGGAEKARFWEPCSRTATALS